MKNFILLMVLVLYINTTKAQPNLIANPSFEVIDTCWVGPAILTNINYFNWFTFSSADIYSNCMLSGYYVPQNQLGFQYPVSGNNYAGVETYNLSDFRDYISGILSEQLKLGKVYCASVYVSLIDTCNVACNSLGMAFTQYLPILNYGQPLNILTPQIQNNISNKLSSHTEWNSIKGSFISTGNELYITIGNFNLTNSSDTTQLDTPLQPLSPNSSYYYLDDVSLIELKALHSNDTLVCPQSNFNQTLKAYPGFDSYLWSTGDTTRIINITQAGTYWVTASNWCGTVTDTIQVNVFNPFGLDQLLGADKTLCDYQFPQRLRPLPQYENTFSNYLWSTGSDTSFTDVLLPGIYYVTAEHLCGLVTDTITLSLAPNPVLNLGNDTTLCIGQQITLNAGNHNSYTWNNQSISPSITINQTGNYSVTVSNALNCIANDNIQVNFVQETAQLLPNDTALYASAFPYSINLSNQYSNYQSNQFTIYNLQFTIQTEGAYSLTAIDNNGCLVRDSINISLKKFELIVPSIINKNQNFIINNLPANSSLKVFDALGQIVYQSNNYQNNFMPLMANAVYLVELVYDVGGASKIKERYNGKLLIIE
jgi:hypothetical protein